MSYVHDVAAADHAGTVTPTRLIVAVHGVGNQVGCETVQSVAARVGAYYGASPALPLGRFYPAQPPGQQVQPMPQLMVDPPDPARLAALKLGFAEVYWAPIARGVVRDGYILEETKKWARTISARVAANGIKNRGWQERDVERLVTVLDELVNAVFVLERLTLVADKAGLFSFNLARLLADFVADVQIVADFESYRQQILDTVDRVMTSSLALSPDGPDGTQLFIVAHSEGSVVAFLSLLHALSDPRRYPWIASVRGLMTIGSPIEIHHLLWPGLWRDRRPALAPSPALANRCVIPWQNYIDDGDPIAYELDATTRWLKETGFAAHLPMTEMTFSRSYLPGKAHLDYWGDEAVFGHFLETIVHPDREGRGTFLAGPPDRRFAKALCLLVPQALLAAVMMLAVYILYRAVAGALGVSHTPLGVGRDVAGIGLLLLGVTAAARIPRIMDRRGWWGLSGVLLVTSMLFYANVTCPATQLRLGGPMARWFGVPDLPIRAASIVDRLPGCNPVPAGAQSEPAAMVLVLIAALVAAVSGILVQVSPRRGDLVLPVAGVLATSGLIVMVLVARGAEPDVEMWPVFLAALVFFYLWWLTALLFDLTFVWQRYVRESVTTNRLEWLSTR